jgi:hypothetical protein
MGCCSSSTVVETPHCCSLLLGAPEKVEVGAIILLFSGDFSCVSLPPCNSRATTD